ncbi:hypothetical protein [Nocardia sp. alder85J]|uniref:hypothetical protein n=1 Tax=Nocardia sp. alder85J TaxID=2862949 RepID=UPI001CD63AAD|nr:hypothetical protein [Nocardia sp. alder85J]MCX4095523.1 hypothetical protein [Nocardia sp. alder85J]
MNPNQGVNDMSWNSQHTNGTHPVAVVSRGPDLRGSIEELAGPQAGDATRHLCAAAIRDRQFRAEVIRELVENQHRVPAPNLGVDGARVLQECLTVRRGALLAGGANIGIAVLGLAIAGPAMILVALLLYQVRVFVGLIGSLVGAVGQRFGWFTRTTARRRSRWILWLVLYFFSTLVTALTTATLTLDSSPDSSPLNSKVFIVIPLWIIVGAAHRYWYRGREAALFTPAGAAAHPEAFPGLRNVFERLRDRSSEVDTVYGTFSPFAGSGVEVYGHDWSYTIELRPNAERRRQGQRAEAMESPDLHHAIAGGLIRLSEGSLYPGDALRRIVVGDRLFRSGWRADPWPQWFGRLAEWDPHTGRPVLRPDWADLLDLAAHERLRHYLEARVELWGYQVVSSVFLRVHVQGDLLQLDGLAAVLPPIAEEYRRIDELPTPEPVLDALAALGWGIVRLPLDLVDGVAECVLGLSSWVRTKYREVWYRSMIAAGRVVDHSPRVCLRELGADLEFQQRFQEADVERFFQSVHRRAVTVVQKELRDRGYDTEQFDRIAQSINNGIQNFNSTVSGPQAAGQNATAAHQVQTPPAQIGPR